MSKSGMEKLHSLLFGEGRELVNIKFFPGSDRELTADRLCNAAADALRIVLNGDRQDTPPVSGRPKTSLREAN